MISIVEALERLAQAKDGQQFKQMIGGLYTANRAHPEVLHKIEWIEKVFIIGRRNR